MPGYTKKLIEVALPLDAINVGSKPETENPFLKGHPRAVHNWWARTPLSVCRAILFAQLIDDPSSYLPEEEAEKKRQDLLRVVRRLATWEAAADENLIAEARRIIRDQFNGSPPLLWDMFAGRASIPMEAQRLGLPVLSSDLNPVAVLIEKALLELPAKFAGQGPVNAADRTRGVGTTWKGVAGLSADVRYYGQWMRDEARARLGSLYPAVQLAAKQGGGRATVNAWLWARTATCPNPACGATMPLVASFELSKRPHKQAWVEPAVDRESGTIEFQIGTGPGKAPLATKVGKRGARFRCIACDSVVEERFIRQEGGAGRIGVQLSAIVADGPSGRIYLSPSQDQAPAIEAPDKPWLDQPMPTNPRWFSPPLYGMPTYGDLFTPRQVVALSTFSDLVGEARERILRDAIAAGLPDDGQRLVESGTQASAYADAVATYLACAVSRLTDYHNALTTWNPTNENISHLFQRQAIPMAWDFAEANPIEGKLNLTVAIDWVLEGLKLVNVDQQPATVRQLDATLARIEFEDRIVVSTDPPYFDNISYADLSDFFYVWLRRSLARIYPDLFATIATPKQSELIASSHRHGSEEDAIAHFRKGFDNAFRLVAQVARGDVPITIYYAFKQQEEDAAGDGIASTGWETMLQGLVDNQYQITGTWPVRTTKKARSVARDTNALASAIVLVCRPRLSNASMATRSEFIRALQTELPQALRALQHESVAPVDLAQAAIGPGMAVFSRYARVLETSGQPMTVRTALALINQTLDRVLAEQESEFDADTRWAIEWFSQHGMDEGPYGDAETLSKAKNTSIDGMARAGILYSRPGKVRLLRRNELSSNWDPARDSRTPIWEMTQHLIHAHDEAGEQGAADLVKRLGMGLGEIARDLAYRLYRICEHKEWAQEAMPYNSLVIAWPQIAQLAADDRQEPRQGQLDV